ncbi:NADH:flavin oxidoreductase/NADH oxidase [Purpureocillium lilacinum]|uniref:NADH:flavin oxidoreductase/NADH oxidase n=1 Tax=Purpureocillium lilacinum TaxID=33203 RepID=A0A179HD06_PURLI|nr:NADH:flavin oxidoreductase/NADH oxidase [Purpureocillium lilacinum]
MGDLHLDRPLTLPCGLALQNRLVKAATTEQLADCDGLPTSTQFHRLYSAWADGGWGLMLTGAVQVDQRYYGAREDLAMDTTRVSEEKTLAAYRKLAETCKGKGTPAILQLNHPGRQSPIRAGKRSYFEKTMAPSSVAMDFGSSLTQRTLASLIFGTPREMTVQDIEDVVQRFASAARLASQAGFDGVQIHAAHGYLLAQFLSAKTNLRTDKYGGGAAQRATLVVDIIHAVRAVVPPNFCIGVKLNSVDHQAAVDPASSSELQDVLEQAKAIAAAGVDFMEVSGGSYENPVFVGDGPQVHEKSEKTLAREAFFLEFAKAIRKALPTTVLMVTGGFRTRRGMEAAIAEGSCDLVGLARPAILRPSLPNATILNRDVSDDEARVATKHIAIPWIVKYLGVKALGAGVESVMFPDTHFRRRRKTLEMSSKYRRDWAYLGIISIQLLGMIFLDLVAFYPKFLYARSSAPLHFLIAIRRLYIRNTGDPFFSVTPTAAPHSPWLQAFLWVELFVQFPLAVYLVWRLSSSRWRRTSVFVELAALVFSCLTFMGSVACCAELWSMSFIKLSAKKKSSLFWFTYLPFAIIPAIIAVDMYTRILLRFQRQEAHKVKTW